MTRTTRLAASRRTVAAALPAVVATAAITLPATLAPVPVAARPAATEPLVTDRPDFTESTETVPEGRTQIEFGATFTRNGGKGGERSDSFGEALVRIATGRRSELRLGVPSFTRMRSSGPAGSRASGLEDATLGAKFRLADGNGLLGLRHPAIALIVETSLPTGNSDFRVRRLQPGAKLCLSADLSETLAVAANLNYARLFDGHSFDEFSGSLTFGFSLTERTGAFLEYFGLFPGGSSSGADRSDTHYVNGGLTYLVHPDLQLDARIGAGLNGRSDDHFLGLGAARRF
jgi:hypothetical protein